MHPLLLVVGAVVTAASSLISQELPQSWADQLHWRSIGPSAMGGRIIGLAVFEKQPSTWWAATASGGLLKTVNNGITFEHQFDREKTVSIGAVAVSQSDKNVLWVGTGENNPRNSASYGNGVYKSVDGGKTFAHMGLDQTFQTGRIAIHPTNPDVVYVGSLGRLYGANDDRGLYKTTDGGKTWERVLFVDDVTGVIDIDMHPTEPDTLMVATYERKRDGFDTNDPVKRWGPGGGIWKTIDGGANWTRVKAGLPTCDLGRIGIDYYRKNPNVLMAVVESEMIAQQPKDAPYHGAQVTSADAGVKVTSVDVGRSGRGRRGDRGEADEAKEAEKPKETPAKAAGLQKDDVVLSINGNRINTQKEFERQCRQFKAGDDAVLAVVRASKDLEIKIVFGTYPEGTRSPFTGTLGGQAGNLQDLQGEDGHEYGGVYKSVDGGDSWQRINTLNPRPMYYSQIRIDPSDSDNIMICGTSLYRSTDGGKTFTSDAGRGMHVDHHAEWIDPHDGNHIIHGCDGGIYITYDACKNWDHLNHIAIGQFYHVGVSADRNYRIYGGLQDNGSWGGPSRTAGTGARNQDWVKIGGGDGFRCEVDPDDSNIVYSQSQNGPPSWRDLSNGQRGSLRTGRRGQGGSQERTRFNWETPYLLSGHNSKIVYTAGNKVFKSLNRGKGMKPISPNITNTDRGAATALAESPVDANVVYVGTDDGALWVTHDGGANWTDCFAVVEAESDEPVEGAVDELIVEGADGSSDPSEVSSRRGPSASVEDGVNASQGEAVDSTSDPVTGSQSISKLVPGPRWVSELVASKFDGKRAYVTLDGHRSDDDAPYILITEDKGVTWRSLGETLPKDAGSTRTIQEDPVNQNVLYLGTEFQTFVSIDRGEHWVRFNGDLPTVSVHAFALNVPSGEAVVATHGRSLWVTSVNEIRQMTEEVMAKDVHFYKPVAAVIWRSSLASGDTNRRFAAENPADGAQLTYHLKKKVESIKLEILDSSGNVVKAMQAPGEQGLHRVSWNLRGAVSIPPGSSERAIQFMRRRGGSRVGLGVYTARLTVDGVEMTQQVKVDIDPDHTDPSWLQSEEEAALLEFLQQVSEDGFDGDR